MPIAEASTAAPERPAGRILVVTAAERRWHRTEQDRRRERDARQREQEARQAAQARIAELEARLRDRDNSEP